VEWGKWPSFILQPLAPLVIMVIPWYFVMLSIVVANYLWTPIRYRFVNAGLSYFGALFVRLKWITGPVAAILLFIDNQKLAAFFALSWPVVTMVLLLFGPTTQIGQIQNALMNQLGYQRRDELAKAQNV
jgi:hypothetical protein